MPGRSVVPSEPVWVLSCVKLALLEQPLTTTRGTAIKTSLTKIDLTELVILSPIGHRLKLRRVVHSSALAKVERSGSPQLLNFKPLNTSVEVQVQDEPRMAAEATESTEEASNGNHSQRPEPPLSRVDRGVDCLRQCLSIVTVLARALRTSTCASRSRTIGFGNESFRNDTSMKTAP